MPHQSKLKIINDPIYGFITVPSADVFALIEHPYFQRLRRITQMGLSYLVYPGANHTRFHHALGCLHLMQKAVLTLRTKGVQISDKEEDALYKAILLHDMGHGPFSHTLENIIIQGVSHEEISLRFMEFFQNEASLELKNGMDLAIQIFKGENNRPFLHQLISSQLDIDRLDYLKRDSFYTGVAEGNINSQRLISMLNVADDRLVVEEKGIYSLENFLSGRRLMYWQVYLHKTSVGAEHLLQSVFRRVHELIQQGKMVPLNQYLEYFIKTSLDRDTVDGNWLERFAQLDDSDILSCIKTWCSHPDFVLSELSRMLLNRQLLKIKLRDKPIGPKKRDKHIAQLKDRYGISDHEAKYFVFDGEITNQGYDERDPIYVLNKKFKAKNLQSYKRWISMDTLSRKRSKYYICYPKSQA